MPNTHHSPREPHAENQPKHPNPKPRLQRCTPADRVQNRTNCQHPNPSAAPTNDGSTPSNQPSANNLTRNKKSKSSRKRYTSKINERSTPPVQHKKTLDKRAKSDRTQRHTTAPPLLNAQAQRVRPRAFPRSHFARTHETQVLPAPAPQGGPPCCTPVRLPEHTPGATTTPPPQIPSPPNLPTRSRARRSIILSPPHSGVARPRGCLRLRAARPCTQNPRHR